MPMTHPALARAQSFSESIGIRVPILGAPTAGACPPSLAIAIANAGGLGACGALLMPPEAIKEWVAETRAGTNGGFQLNLWIPDPIPVRNQAAEDAVRNFLALWGPEVPRDAADRRPPDFAQQCEAMLELRPAVISSIMGIYPPAYVARIKALGIRWFATVTTVADAKAAEQAGADAIVAQGMEAGGHRGAFDAATAEAETVGLFALLPQIVDAVGIPVIATGGIADARGVAAALVLGASAVQIGTGFLRSPEAKLPRAWANAIGDSFPEQTMLTRAFSGRAGRAIANAYARAAARSDAPAPAPYPVQRGLSQPMRAAAVKSDDIDRMQAWVGQSGRLAPSLPAGEIVHTLWEGAQSILG